MKTFRSFSGWFALTVMIILWALAVYGYLSIEQQKNNYATLVANANAEAQTVAQASRLHGLMNETKGERAALSGVISADVIALVDAVDAVGKTIGIDIQVSNVQPEAPKKGAPAGAPIPVGFVVQAQGSYAQISRLIELLTALPIPSTVQQFELARSGTSWGITVKVRALTASEISS